MPSIRNKLASKQSKLATVKERLEDHPANLNDLQDGGFYFVEVGLIHPDPDQPRKYFDPGSLEELSQSIKQKGVLQPVIIRKDETGNIILVAGERRFKASKLAGLKKIPAIVTKGNPLEISIIENLQRENLSPIEEAEALNRMVENHGYTQDKLAFVIGKAKSTVSETLSLTRLPEEIKSEVRRAEQYPRRLLLEIAKLGSNKEMISLFTKIKEGNLKSDQVRQITRKKQEKTQRTPAALAIDKALSLSNQLLKIDLNTTEQVQKVELISELQNLKKVIHKLLS